MKTVLPILYLIALAVQLGFLLWNVKQPDKARWKVLYLIELVFLLLALILAFYYNGLPGTGIMPGMAYFAETFFSMAATGIFGVMLVVSLVLGLMAKFKKRK